MHPDQTDSDMPKCRCRACGVATPFTATQLCNACWHIDVAGVDPRLARRAAQLLAAVKDLLNVDWPHGPQEIYERERAYLAVAAIINEIEAPCP
jgi:hypothetical protein